MAQAIEPRDFKSSEDLDTTDFLDLPICKATELGIKEEYLDFMKNNVNYKWKH